MKYFFNLNCNCLQRRLSYRIHAKDLFANTVIFSIHMNELQFRECYQRFLIRKNFYAQEHLNVISFSNYIFSTDYYWLRLMYEESMQRDNILVQLIGKYYTYMKYFFKTAAIDDHIILLDCELYIDNPDIYIQDNVKLLFTLTDKKQLCFLKNIQKNNKVCYLTFIKDYAILSKLKSLNSRKFLINTFFLSQKLSHHIRAELKGIIVN